ncbi:MAG: hypothetical protein GY765_31010 [bacterium]|nr:hypothetical protein [bacterium]
MLQKTDKIKAIIVLLFLAMFMFPGFQAAEKSPKLDFETMVKKIRSLKMRNAICILMSAAPAWSRKGF